MASPQQQGGEALAQAGQRSVDAPFLGNIHSQVGQGLGQPGIPVHSARVGTRWFLRYLPPQIVPGFCDSQS